MVRAAAAGRAEELEPDAGEKAREAQMPESESVGVHS
jgi:hypothetical protein